MRETPETESRPKYIIKFRFYPEAPYPCQAALFATLGQPLPVSCGYGTTWEEAERDLLERFRLWKLSQVPEDKIIYLT